MGLDVLGIFFLGSKRKKEERGSEGKNLVQGCKGVWAALRDFQEDRKVGWKEDNGVSFQRNCVLCR